MAVRRFPSNIAHPYLGNGGDDNLNDDNSDNNDNGDHDRNIIITTAR